MRGLRTLLCGILLLTAHAAADTSAGGTVQQPTKAIVLGVGSPAIDASRAGTSVAVATGGMLYLFDAGPGVERRLLEARTQLASMEVRRFGPIFITHLHHDHTLGLAALYRYHRFAASSALIPGAAPLAVYGPAGIRTMMHHIAQAFVPLEPATRDALSVTAEDLKAPGVAYRDDNVTVRMFDVQHKDGPALGYRVETADRVIVISGDTRPVDAVVDACNGCDILFHEVFGLDYGPEGPPRTGPPAGHTSATELGELARRAKPKLLVLYHTLGASPDALVERIKKSFSGSVAYARDLDVF
jgi:ribonuclease BN (tRNA processing enzyme)